METVIFSGGFEDIDNGGTASSETILNGGSKYLSSGGTASGMIVSGRGYLEIDSGGTVTGLTLSSGATEIIDITISSGQTSSGLIVSSGGTLTVLSGGTAVSAVALGGGIIVEGGVLSGGVASSGGQITVDAGGVTLNATLSGYSDGTYGFASVEAVNSGATASDTVLGRGGTLYLYAGNAVGTVISSGGYESVFSGGTAGHATILDGGFEYVSSGGTASGMLVSSGGSLEIDTGGIASGVTVLSGGEIVLNGGVVTALILSSGATEIIFTFVSSGQTVSGAVVSSGGPQTVLSGGQTTGTIVLNGGEQLVSGGLTIGTVLSGGYQLLSSGAASGTIISGGGTLSVTAGVAKGTVISSAGFEFVYSSGTTSGETILDGGHEYVEFGGSATGTIVSSGGHLEIDSDGTASGVTVLSGGDMVVSSGGAASSTIISSGGSASINGVDSGATIKNGGREDIYGDGSAVGTIVSSGGVLEIDRGATAASTVALGGVITLSGGVLSDGVATSGGLIDVESGGVSLDATLSGAVISYIAGLPSEEVVLSFAIVSKEIVHSGAIASGAVISDRGDVDVDSGGTAAGMVVSGGGELDVFGTASSTTLAGGFGDAESGGRANGTVIGSAGEMEVAFGGTASDITISSGGSVFDYGVDSGTIILNGGRENVGGLAGGTIVSSGGFLEIDPGGTASGVTVLSGGEIVLNGMVTGLTLSSGATEFIDFTVSSGQTSSGFDVISGGTVTVALGGAAVNAMVSSGGRLDVAGTASSTMLSGTSANIFGTASEYVYDYGRAAGTIIGSAGYMYVAFGGATSGTIISSGGSADVTGVDSGATIKNGGREDIYEGGSAVGTTVCSGGYLEIGVQGVGYQVISGYAGAASDVTVLSGGELVVSGGRVSGLTVSSGAELSDNTDFAVNGDSVTTVVGSGEDFLRTGQEDIFVRLANDQLAFWQLSGAGELTSGLALTVNGALLTIDDGTSVVGGGEDFLTSGDRDVFVRLSSGQLIFWQFDATGGLTNGIAFTVNGAPLTIDTGTSIVGGGEDFFGSGSKDLFLRTTSGQLILWQFDGSGRFIYGVAFTMDGDPLTIDIGTSVVGGGEDFLGSGNEDLFLRTTSGQLILWQFDGSARFIYGVAFTMDGDPLTIDTGTSVVGGGEDFFGSGSKDLFLRTASGQLVLWQFDSSGRFASGTALTADGAALTIDSGTSVVGGGEDFLGSGDRDVFVRLSSGQLIFWQFDATGRLTDGVAFTVNGAPLTIDTATSVVGGGEDLFGSGVKDVFLRTASGQLILWQFDRSGQFASGLGFTTIVAPLTIDPGTSVIGGGEDLLNTGVKDVFLRTASGQLIVWQFDGTGRLSSIIPFIVDGAPLTIDTGTSVVGGGEDLLASGGKDVFLRIASGQLILWQFDGLDQFTYGIAFTANDAPFTIDTATTVIGAGHDSANGDMALKLRYGNGQTALFDLTGSALTPAPSGAVLSVQAFGMSEIAAPRTAIDTLNSGAESPTGIGATPDLSSALDGTLSRLIQAMASQPSSNAPLDLAGAALTSNDPALRHALAAHH